MERDTSQTANQKVSAETVKMNYKPVSNLGFISKIVEKSNTWTIHWTLQQK